MVNPPINHDGQAQYPQDEVNPSQMDKKIPIPANLSQIAPDFQENSKQIENQMAYNKASPINPKYQNNATANQMPPSDKQSNIPHQMMPEYIDNSLGKQQERQLTPQSMSNQSMQKGYQSEVPIERYPARGPASMEQMNLPEQQQQQQQQSIPMMHMPNTMMGQQGLTSKVHMQQQQYAMQNQQYQQMAYNPQSYRSTPPPRPPSNPGQAAVGQLPQLSEDDKSNYPSSNSMMSLGTGKPMTPISMVPSAELAPPMGSDYDNPADQTLKPVNRPIPTPTGLESVIPIPTNQSVAGPPDGAIPMPNMTQDNAEAMNPNQVNPSIPVPVNMNEPNPDTNDSFVSGPPQANIIAAPPTGPEPIGPNNLPVPTHLISTDSMNSEDSLQRSSTPISSVNSTNSMDPKVSMRGRYICYGCKLLEFVYF